MQDLDRIKRNVLKMVDMNAPEADIDAYIGEEGVTLDTVRSHRIAPVAAPQKQESFAASIPGRMLHGAADPAYGISQIVPRGISYAASLGDNFPNAVSEFYAKDAGNMDRMTAERAKEYDAARRAAGQVNEEGELSFDAARLAGNIVSPANLAGGQMAAKLPAAATTMGKMLQGAGMGAGFSAAAPVEDMSRGSFAEQKGMQMGTGAAFGAAAPAIGEGIARVISPKLSPNVKTLMDEGVTLTPGQIMGGTGQRVEDAMTSMPVIGDMINSARTKGIEGMNIAVANRALAPLGQKVPDNISAGHDLVSYVKQTLSKSYDDLLPQLTGKIDDQFSDDLAKLRDMSSSMPDQQAKQFQKIVDLELGRKISPNGSITGESLKEIESALGRQAKGYLKDTNQDQRNLGAALEEVQSSLRAMIQRSNPQHAEKLKSINEGYANYARLRSASASTGAHEGVFSPAQLNSAVRGGDMSVGKGRYAEGDALLQDLSGAAREVLPSKISDSGTVGRSLVNLGALGAGYAVNPAVAAGLVSSAGLYTKPGLKMAEMLLARRPEGAAAAADLVRKVTSPADLARLLMGGGNVATARGVTASP
jgi:hypothetical protein